MAETATIPPTIRSSKESSNSIPPLEPGDELHHGEFLRRFEAMPNLKKAELIRGLVFPMASPVSLKNHAEPDSLLGGWLFTYAADHKNLSTATNATVKLDPENVFQPDALLRRDDNDASSTIDEDDGYLSGAPELVVEIASSSVSRDAGAKKAVYLTAGVSEYILWRVEDGEIDWLHNNRTEGLWEELPLDQDTGCIESSEFPGLILNVDAALRLDAKTVLTTLQTNG